MEENQNPAEPPEPQPKKPGTFEKVEVFEHTELIPQPKLEEKESKAEEEDLEKEKQKELMEAVGKLETPSLKSKSLYLYSLSEDMEKNHTKNFKTEEKELDIKEQDSTLVPYFNKIRDVIKNSSNIDSYLDDKDESKYGVQISPSETNSPIDKFWKKSLINSKFFQINENDEKILDHLIDMVYTPLEFPNFKVEFIFEENDFMNETVLSKSYFFQGGDKSEPSSTEATVINWKSEIKDPSKKIVKKNKKKGKVKETTTIVKDVESFFNIFKENKEPNDKDTVEANFIRNDFIPNILEYYLNIMEINYEDGGEEEEEEN